MLSSVGQSILNAWPEPCQKMSIGRLIQRRVLGLLTALRKFNPATGVPF